MEPALVEFGRQLFGGDAATTSLSASQIAMRAVIVYLAGLIIIRVGKSRLLSGATPLDLILAFILGSVLSRGINGDAAFSGTLAATATLVSVHWGLTALACRFRRFEFLIKGGTRVLVRDGDIDRIALRRSHMSDQDLAEQLRLKANVSDPHKVKLAVKERSGEIGVVKMLPTQSIEVRVEKRVQIVRIEISS